MSPEKQLPVFFRCFAHFFAATVCILAPCNIPHKNLPIILVSVFCVCVGILNLFFFIRLLWEDTP